MGQGGPLPELRAGIAGEPEGPKRGGQIALELVLGHSVPQGGQPRPIGGDGHVVGSLHQSNFGLRFEHPAAGRHRCRHHHLDAGGGLANALGHEKPDPLLDADATVFDPPVLHDPGNHRVGAFFLLPHSDLVAEGGLEQLAGPIFLEPWADIGELTCRRDHHTKRPLALAPPHPGVVEAAGGALHEDRVHLVVGHQSLCLVDPLLPLVVADRDDAVRHRLEGSDGRRHLVAGLGVLLGASRRHRTGAHGRCLQKTTSIDVHVALPVSKLRDPSWPPARNVTDASPYRTSETGVLS